MSVARALPARPNLSAVPSIPPILLYTKLAAALRPLVHADLKALKKRLKEQFPKTDLVPKPVKINGWDGQAKWLRYCYEFGFKRRISIVGERHDKETGKRRQCRDTANSSPFALPTA